MAAKPSLTERLLKNSTLTKRTETLDNSKVHSNKKLVPTVVPAINIGLSGSPMGGLGCGLTMIAGPSKHFKTLFGLIMAAAYMKAKPDAVCLFYDSEFGAGQSYFKSVGIDPQRVVHTPITNIEELKFDIMNQLDHIEEEDDVILFIDSIGNLASKKEVEDALDMKAVADMTRAKQLKSLWRIVTPHLTLKDIPLIAINHTYQCGTEKMTVLLPDGTTKSIKDVVAGDQVMTIAGPEAVKWTTEHDGAWITEIELESGEILEFTDGHRFMVEGEWKYVCDLREGEIIDSYK